MDESVSPERRRAAGSWRPVDATASSVIKRRETWDSPSSRLVAEEHKRAGRALIGRGRVLAMDVQRAAGSARAASQGGHGRAAAAAAEAAAEGAAAAAVAGAVASGSGSMRAWCWLTTHRPDRRQLLAASPSARGRLRAAKQLAVE